FRALLAGMATAVRSLEPGTGPAGIAAIGVAVGVVGIGVVVGAAAERRGRNRTCGSDSSTRNAGGGAHCATRDVGGSADGSAVIIVVIAAMGGAIIPCHSGARHRGRDERRSGGELKSLHWCFSLVVSSTDDQLDVRRDVPLPLITAR